MDTIDIHIIDLLKKYDCVIVPDFGGFLLKAMPARISGAMHEIMPPSKGIIFNRNLTVNDGLLINQVAQKENIGYTLAQAKVYKFADESRNAIQNKGTLELKGIGIFNLGNEGTWQFTPTAADNFLLSSFGLNTLQLSPVEVNQHNKNRREANPAVIDLSENKSLKYKNIVKGIAVAASVLIVFAVSFLFYNNHVSEEGTIANWYKKVSEFQQDENKNDNAASSNNASALVIEKSEPVQNTNIDIEKSTEQSGTAEETNNEVAQPENDIQSAGFNFFVIGGSFTKEKNAKAFARKLEQKGYKSEVLDNENGLFRVAYHKESDSLSADHFLQGIKKENQSAWILKW